MRFLRRTPDLLSEQRKQLESPTTRPRQRRFWRALLLDDAIGLLILGSVAAVGAVALYFGQSQRTAEVLVIVTAIILFLWTDPARLRLRRRMDEPSPPPPMTPSDSDAQDRIKTYHGEITLTGWRARLLARLMSRGRTP
jgi:hypothetical protein